MKTRNLLASAALLASMSPPLSADTNWTVRALTTDLLIRLNFSESEPEPPRETDASATSFPIDDWTWPGDFEFPKLERLTSRASLSIDARAILLPLRRPIVSKVGRFDDWPMILIDEIGRAHV